VTLPAALPELWQWLAHALLGAVLAWAAWRAPWTRLAGNEGSHVFLGTIVALALLWMMSGRLGTAVQFHLLGATLAYLMFGLPLAVIAMTAVVFAATAAGAAPWPTVSLNALVSGVLPVLVAHAVLRTTEARLPWNLFVYVFVAAFFGAALAMVLSAGAGVALLATGLPPGAASIADWLPMLVLLGFGEATLTGMLAALFVVYRPTWVGTFSDERYLGRRS
jgi:uncharacterized membrane protein